MTQPPAQPAQRFRPPLSPFWRALFRRVAWTSAAVLAIAVAWHVWYFGVLGPRYRREAAAARAEAWSRGIPTDIAQFKALHPSTQEGDAVVRRADEILRQMDVLEDLKEGGRTLSDRWLAMVPLASPDDLLVARLQAEPYSNQEVDYARARLAKRRELMQEVGMLRRASPETNLLLSPESEPAWLNLEGYARRTVARSMLPVMISEEICAERVDAGYAMLMDGLFLSRALAGKRLGLVGSMGYAHNMGDMLRHLRRLVEDHPPDAATYRELIGALDPEHLMEILNRGWDGDVVRMVELMEFVRWNRSTLPVESSSLQSMFIPSGTNDVTFLDMLSPAFLIARSRVYRRKATMIIDDLGASCFHAYLILGRPYHIVEGADAERTLVEAWILNTEFYRKQTPLDHVAVQDRIESEIAGGNWFTRLLGGSYTRAAIIGWRSASETGMTQTILRLRLLEMESPAGEFVPPASLEELAARDGLPIPQDYLGPPGTPLGYEVLPHLGLIAISRLPAPSGISPSETYWATYGERMIEAVVVAHEKPVGRDPRWAADADSRLNQVMTVQLDGGQQVHVICAERVADAVGFPESFPVGSRVRLRKRPVTLEINTHTLALDVAIPGDIELISAPGP